MQLLSPIEPIILIKQSELFFLVPKNSWTFQVKKTTEQMQNSFESLNEYVAAARII